MEDRKDYHRLHELILTQAINDYIKLQHVSRITKQSQRAAWKTAKECIYSDSYRAEYLFNEHDKKMNLSDLCKAATDRENVNIQRFRSEIKKRSFAYWKEKWSKAVLPEYFAVGGECYRIISKLCGDYETHSWSLEGNTIFIKAPCRVSEHMAFEEAQMHIILTQAGVTLAKKEFEAVSQLYSNAIHLNYSHAQNFEFHFDDEE